MSANRWPKGQKVPGSGRKKGGLNKPKRHRLGEKAKAIGRRLLLPDLGIAPETEPLDFLLAVMRHGELPLEVRLHAARCAAPYRHRALKSVDVSGEVLLGVSRDLHAFIAGNAGAPRSFVGFDDEDRDAQEAAHERALPHH
jgi:hypothetical protein